LKGTPELETENLIISVLKPDDFELLSVEVVLSSMESNLIS